MNRKICLVLTFVLLLGTIPVFAGGQPTPKPSIRVAYGQSFEYEINGETFIDKTILDQEYFEYEDIGVKTIVAKEIIGMGVQGSDTVEVELTDENPHQEVWFELYIRIEIGDGEDKEELPLIPLEPSIPIEPEIPLTPLEPSKPVPEEPSKPRPPYTRPTRPSRPNVPSNPIEPVETPIVPPKISDIEKENFISRWEHHRELGKEIIYHKEKEIVKFDLSMNDRILLSENGLQPRLYQWNTEKEKWVALATKIGDKVESYNELEGHIAIFAVKQPTFADVKGTEWFVEKLDRANGLGIVEGVKDKEVILDPNSNVTRKEVYTMVGRIFGAVEEGNTSLYNELGYIKENSGSDWYKPYLKEFVDREIIREITELEANEEVTRKEVSELLIKMLNRVAKADTRVLGFQITDIMNGYEDNTLRLDDKITRIETITLLVNALEKLGW